MTIPWDNRFGQNAADYNALLNTSVQTSAVLNAGNYGETVNINPTFAVDLTDWSAFNNLSFTRANDQVAPGQSWSARLVPNGGSNICGFGCSQYPATVGRYYGVSGWIRCEDAEPDLQLKIDWRDSGGGFPGGGYIANLGGVPADTWVFVQGFGLAPATTVAFNLALIINQVGNIPSSEVFWGGDLRIMEMENVAVAQALLAPRGESWNVNRVFVSASSQTLEATATTYRNTIAPGNYIESTFAGSSGDSTDTPLFLSDGQPLWVEWRGGDLDATYTATVSGWRSTPQGGFVRNPV